MKGSGRFGYGQRIVIPSLNLILGLGADDVVGQGVKTEPELSRGGVTCLVTFRIHAQTRTVPPSMLFKEFAFQPQAQDA